MNHSLKTKIFVSMILISLLPLVLFEFANYNIVSTSLKRLTDENIANVNDSVINIIDINQKVLLGWLDSSSSSLEDHLTKFGKSRLDFNATVDVGGNKVPIWYFGDYRITFDDKLLDDFLERQKIFATILQFQNNKFLRIATNVKQIDGTKIVGSVIESGPVYETLMQGKRYFGHSKVEGIDFATLYKPLYDGNNELIGALVVGRREHDFELIDTINKIKIGESGFVSIVDSQGNFIVHPQLKGENNSGDVLLREIFQRKNGVISYESNDQTKMAYFTYYAPLQWYVISTFNLSDLHQANNQITNFLLCFCIVILVVSISVSYYLSAALFRPISRLTIVMREVQNGNLNARFKHESNNEFMMVALVFNTMLENLSSLIKRILHSSSNLRDASFNLIDDISASNEALNCMGSGIENLRQSIVNVYSTSMTTDTSNEDIMKCFDEIHDALREHFDKTILDADDCVYGDIFTRLDTLRRLIIMKHMISNDNSHISSSISFQNKISNIEVELAKLKLLIRYISTSASSLDDIAISLDRYASVFNFDEGLASR